MKTSQNITIIDPQYKSWVQELVLRYRQSQIKAAVKVNQEALMFYWSLGRDIVNLQAESKWGSKLLKNLSEDLKKVLPDVGCLSETNLLYMKNFYLLYQPITPQVGEQLVVNIFSIPWARFTSRPTRMKTSLWMRRQSDNNLR